MKVEKPTRKVNLLSTLLWLPMGGLALWILWQNLFGSASYSTAVKLDCSTAFVIMGLLGLLSALIQRRGIVYALLLLGALICGALGDRYLGDGLALGAGLFASEHILLTVALCL